MPNVTLYNAAAANLRIVATNGVAYNVNNAGAVVVPDSIQTEFFGIGFSPNAGGGGSAAWGAITGTIGNQTDLQTALGLKADAAAMTSALALKADASAVTASLALKADLAALMAATIQSKSADYPIVAADAGTILFHPVGDNNARTFTIPANGTIAMPVGSILGFINMSAAALAIAITSDTMNLAGAGTTGTRSLAQFGVATATKITTTIWLISGTNLT